MSETSDSPQRSGVSTTRDIGQSDVRVTDVTIGTTDTTAIGTTDATTIGATTIGASLPALRG